MADIRKEYEYPIEVRNAVGLCAMSPVQDSEQGTRIVGSYSYRQHAHPSDVDVMSSLEVPLPQKAAAEYFAYRLQLIMQALEIDRSTFFVEFKCGFVPAYYADRNLSAAEFLKKHRDTLAATRVTELENAKTKEEQMETIRQIYTLRWKPEDLISGVFKTYKSRYSITLAEALMHDSVIKLDIVTWAQNRFVSVETWYMLAYKHNGKVHHLTSTEPYLASLEKDLLKYSEVEHYNPLKFLKRAWLLSRATGNKYLLDKITPIVNSPQSALNQIKADIEILLFLIESYRGGRELDAQTRRRLSTEVMSMPGRLAPYLSILPKNFMYGYDQAYKDFRNDRLGNLQPLLSRIEKEIKPIINEGAHAFIKTLSKQLK